MFGRTVNTSGNFWWECEQVRRCLVGLLTGKVMFGGTVNKGNNILVGL